MYANVENTKANNREYDKNIYSNLNFMHEQIMYEYE